MRHSVFLSLLLAFLIFSCNTASDYLQKANSAIDNKKYREAIKLLDRALKKNAYLSEAYTEKAYCYSSINKDDSAIMVYNKLLSFSPKNTLALYNAGNCKYRLEQFDQAIDYFNNAMISKGYNPKDTSGTQINLEYTPFGKEILGKQDKFDVPLVEIFYMSGLSHYGKGEINKAYNYFNKCISRNYNPGESNYMIGLCWLAVNKKEKACQSFKQSSGYGYSLANAQAAKVCNE